MKRFFTRSSLLASTIICPILYIIFKKRLDLYWPDLAVISALLMLLGILIWSDFNISKLRLGSILELELERTKKKIYVLMAESLLKMYNFFANIGNNLQDSIEFA